MEEVQVKFILKAFYDLKQINTLFFALTFGEVLSVIFFLIF